ncbi:MAG: S41 family peptidase [Bacteroidales bacterium]|jgi:carboxyl-terminal processing protease|nr:S41 family peptidase [Bacteroidales bacterium]MEE1083398.1 S41 family peptidase [Paludibacteraceae bacterium]
MGIKRNKIYAAMIGLLVAVAPTSVMANKNAEVSRNLEIYSTLLRELDMFYVDTFSVEKTVETGINAMLNKIDPYTMYIPEREMDDLKFMTTGTYAGVGSVISQRDSLVMIQEVYENSPSHKYGLKAGDVLLSVDGEKVIGSTTSDVSKKLRGVAGTSVKVVVKRGDKEVTLNIVRDNITISSLNLAKNIGDNIGYIHLTGFTTGTADLFKTELKKLKQSGIQGLIIDLRSNPGGILSEAVDIVGCFVEKGTKVVYTKSKIKEWDETFSTTKDPVDLDMPIVVMVNGESASAAEIVSGALQDLDRAVILGERTYGKGLVQTSRSLPFGGSLKLTISKYHIPSGRCIQAIDYARTRENGKKFVIPDSLTHEFKTKNGRIVKDGCGVMPDTVYTGDSVPAQIVYQLYVKNIIFDYCTKWAAEHPTIPSVQDFKFTDWQDFKNFVVSKDFSYKTEKEKLFDALVEKAKKDSTYEAAKQQYDALQMALFRCQDEELDKNKDEIIQLISTDLAQRYYYQKGASEESLKYDKETKRASDILRNKNVYNAILSTSKKSDK